MPNSNVIDKRQDENQFRDNGVERRFIHSELRIKTRDDGGESNVIEGYSAKFNTWAEIWPGFFERVAPGAFAESIQNDDVRCLFNHDMNYPLGRNKAGNLLLKETETGLWEECEPTDTSYARDLKINIRAGVITQQSFAFEIMDWKNDQEWLEKIETDENGNDHYVYYRTIKKAKLYDVSPVTFPAYEDTTVAMRSLERYKAAIPPVAPVEERTEQEETPAESEIADGGEVQTGIESEPELDLRIRETGAKLKHKYGLN